MNIHPRLGLLSLVISFSLIHAADVGHKEKGIDYSQPGAGYATSAGVSAYATFRHGPDGARLLDPYFIPQLDSLQGKHLLDAGCGAAPWSIYAAQRGATVQAIDIQEGMIARAKKDAEKAGAQDSIQFEVGSVDNLPYQNDSFDAAISINVGCNLPSEIFQAHFKEMFRCLKPGGTAIVTAPASLKALFTSDVEPVDLKRSIRNLLSKSSDPKVLNELGNAVLRGSFVCKDDRLVQIDSAYELSDGDAIWRKIPGLVVPNFYHDEEAYQKAAQAAGFEITRIETPRIDSKDSLKKDGTVLGYEYLVHPAFIILYLNKRY